MSENIGDILKRCSALTGGIDRIPVRRIRLSSQMPQHVMCPPAFAFRTQSGKVDRAYNDPVPSAGFGLR